jgi:CheY-like chemotaxis protein
VIEKQVRRWGMRPESTYSGKEALAMMRNQISMGQPYDILIIDHDMPVMNGLQLAERIQQDKDIDHKPALLMLTGMNVTVVREDAVAVGIQQLLAKPASGDRLRQALQGLRFRRQSSIA